MYRISFIPTRTQQTVNRPNKMIPNNNNKESKLIGIAALGHNHK